VIDGRINLRKLEIFCLVVDLGNVSEAARELHLVQPAVSEHIRSLESRLDCKLIVRRGRGFEVTDAGARLRAWAGDILGRARELDRELAGLKSGEHGAASIGASMSVGTYLLPPIVADFAVTRPQAQIALRTSVMRTAVAGALDGSLDFAVVIAGGRPPLADVVMTPLSTERFVLVAAASQDPPAAVDLDELGELTFVCMANDAVRESLIDAPLQRLGLGPRRVALQLGHPEGIKRTVERGVGVAFLLRAVVERELENGVLREIRSDVSLSGQIALVHRKDRGFSPLQHQLMDEISETLARRDAG
jgi:DNA-binding transcriptional LysR family regulator